MATVKLQNGNVVLKNGLVSCECCCIISEDLLNASITQKDCEDSLGKFCSRCGPIKEYPSFLRWPTENCWPYPLDYSGVKWPTLPCAGNGISSGLLGEDIFNSPVPGRYRRSGACIRFYYRIVNESDSEEGTVLREGQTANAARGLKSGVELWLPYREDKPNLFVNESCGLYIYSFKFLFWTSSCTPDEFWASKGGAQYNQDGTCNRLAVYDVDMFFVTQNGPYEKWPPNWDDPYWGYNGCPCT